MERSNTAIVTGAYGAIGKAIARQLVERGIHTMLVGRDEVKLQEAVDEIVRQTGKKDVQYKVVDLSGKKNIYDFSSGWDRELDILINNGCTAPRHRTETPEGIEMQFATNVLGYFWMINAFSALMKASEGARIINVASYWAGGMDLNDPEFKKRRYNNNDAYRQSKQADRMITVAFADRLGSTGITVNSCHPGDVNSKVSNDLGFGGHESPDQGAATPVWLATDPGLKGVTGKYFADKNLVHCNFSEDIAGIERLYKLCQSY